MGISFDFSKVKKAGKAKSLNDLYAAGIPGLTTDPEPKYGDSKKENQVPDVLKKFKNTNTKRRIERQLYGNDNEQFKKDNLADPSSSIGDPNNVKSGSELEEINRLRTNALPLTEYGSDYWKDFGDRVNQIQRTDMPNGITVDYLKNLYNGIGQKYVSNKSKTDEIIKNLDNGAQSPLLGLTREYSENYYPGLGFVTNVGRYPENINDINNNVAGSVSAEDMSKKITWDELGLKNPKAPKSAWDKFVQGSFLPFAFDDWGSVPTGLNYPFKDQIIDLHSHPSEHGASNKDKASLQGKGFVYTKSGKVLPYDKNSK